MANHRRTITPTKAYPLINAKERLLIWRRVRGMWKGRKPEPIQELKKMRREWERNTRSR